VRLLPFLAVAIVIIITPGVDTALVTKNALVHGRRAAVATALGVNVGIAFWTVAAAVGLAAVLAASSAAFDVLKIAGAAYLVYLGLRALLASHERPALSAPALASGTAFRQGVVSNLLNPKIAVFFTALLPQFAGAGGAVTAKLLLLGALFNGLCVGWLVGYAVLAARGRDLLQRPRVQRMLDRLSGLVLVGLGVRLALERR
jgi:threonine/homoserine/homoserine lactone efflux protein